MKHIKHTTLFFAWMILISAKVFSQPTFDFARSFGGSSLDGSSAVKVDGSGNVYTIGTFTGTADFDTGPGVSMLTSNGQQDIFILKLDSLGNQIWNKRIGGVDPDYATGLVLDGSGNLYITGYFGDTVDFDPGAGIMNVSSAFYSTFIMKMDAAGNPVWVKTIDPSGFFGGSRSASIELDNSGNVICTGTFNGQVDFDPGAGTFILNDTNGGTDYLLKLTGAGSFVFVKEILCTEIMYSKALKTDPAGNIYYCGAFNDSLDTDPGPGTSYLVSPDGFYEGFVAKYSPSGVLIWSKALGENPVSPDTRANSIGLDALGNVYVCGHFSNACDFDPGPATFSLAPSGADIHVFIVKLDNTGNFIWAKDLAGDDGQAYGMYVDAAGNQFITGHFLDYMDCDPTSGVSNLYSNASYFDVYTVILNSSGNLECAFNIGSSYHDYGYAIDVNASKIYMTGAYSLTCDFDPGFSYVPFTSQGNVDVFVARYNAQSCMSVTTSIDENEMGQLTVFPNPAEEILHISWSGKPAFVSLLNGVGQKVIKEQYLTEKVTAFDIQTLPSGIYFLILNNEKESICKKIIKR